MNRIFITGGYWLKQFLACLTSVFLILLMSLTMPVAYSDEYGTTQSELRKLLAERFDSLEITELTPSPVKGIYELVSNGQIFYISEDANHLFTGALIDTETRSDLTAARKGKVQLDLINQIDEKDMLIYEASTAPKATLTVFTDTSCPYCSRLHAEIDELLDEGIRVRYLMFPRAGLGSNTHQELESIWCAKNPLEAMTTAKKGGYVKPATCANPIESHVNLAELIGLRGTPLIYLDDGQSIPGYRSASELITLIEESED